MTLVVKNIVLGPDAKVVSSKSKGYIGQVVPCLALDRVLSVGVSRSAHIYVTRKRESGIAQQRVYARLYMRSAKAQGSVIMEEPVSIEAPMPVSSAVSSPKDIEVKSTSQVFSRRRGSFTRSPL